MTFRQWLYGENFNNPSINGQWGLLHIITLLTCIALIIGITLIFKFVNPSLVMFVAQNVFVRIAKTRMTVSASENSNLNPIAFKIRVSKSV